MRDSFFMSLIALVAGLSIGVTSIRAEQPKPSGEEAVGVEKKEAGARKKNPRVESKAVQNQKKPEKAEKPTKAEESKEPDEPEKEEEADDGKKEIATLKVEAKPFKISAKLSGIVESKHQSPVSMNLDRWTDLTIVTAVPHGTEVKEGDLLFQLETQPLEKKIRELKVGMPLKELDLQTARQELEKLEKTTPLSLERSRLSMEQAEEDLIYFDEVTKPMRIRSAKEDLKSTENYLSYAEEELRQLKKMYEEDDMTEETEEIILLRQQNSVDAYKWMLEQTEARTERTLETNLPREEDNLKRSFELREIDYKAGEKATKDALKRKVLDVEAKNREFEEAQLSLTEFEADFKQMAPKAPHDGIVYYGMNQRGKWTTASAVERKLIPGGKLSMREIAMTVVDPSSVHLRVAVPEKQLKGLKKGLEGELKLQWNPDVELKGKVDSISFVPFADNTFDAVISIPNAGNARIVPGMKGDLELVIYEKESALAVPKTAVEKKGKVSTVTMKNGDKRKVRTGQSNGNLIEITGGLKAGDEIQTSTEKKDEEAGGKKGDEKASAKPEEKK